MSKYKPCPCGQIPSSLHVEADHNNPKYALVMGGCCNEWIIEFRNGYTDIDSEGAHQKAEQAWNSAPRKHLAKEGV